MKKSIIFAAICGTILTSAPFTSFAESPESERELKQKHEQYNERKEDERREDSAEYDRRLKNAEDSELLREELERRIIKMEAKLSTLREWLLHFEKAVENSEGRKKHLYELRVKIIDRLIAKLENKLSEAKTHLEQSKITNLS